MQRLSLDDVTTARDRIASYVNRTPTLHHRAGDIDLFLKAESLQPTGAFKLRGAFNMLATLPSGTGVGRPLIGKSCPGRRAGRAAAGHERDGGHAQRRPATEESPNGGQRRPGHRGRTGQRRTGRSARSNWPKMKGLVPVPPFDHPLIAAGQGTAALEMLEEAPTLDRFYCPISGGGLMAGCATVLADRQPACEIIGVEPADADDTRRSLAAGTRVSVPPPKTIADGLRVRRPGRVHVPDRAAAGQPGGDGHRRRGCWRRSCGPSLTCGWCSSPRAPRRWPWRSAKGAVGAAFCSVEATSIPGFWPSWPRERARWREGWRLAARV